MMSSMKKILPVLLICLTVMLAGGTVPFVQDVAAEEAAAEAVGLPGNEARAVLAAGSFAAAVDADWRRAGELGVTAVPTHLCAGRRLVGFSPYEDFVRLIERE
jgi:predicted DsbA family dithiol-disulfide isomerase